VRDLSWIYDISPSVSVDRIRAILSYIECLHMNTCRKSVAGPPDALVGMWGIRFHTHISFFFQRYWFFILPPSQVISRSNFNGELRHLKFDQNLYNNITLFMTPNKYH
jgi:hypothetical protein